MNERADLVGDIEKLYPPDANDSGRELLLVALCCEWRSLPIDVLTMLRQLCIRKDRAA